MEITLAIMATTTTVEIGAEEVVQDLINLEETSLSIRFATNMSILQMLATLDMMKSSTILMVPVLETIKEMVSLLILPHQKF